MNYTELCNFIESKMRMSHIYQPILLKTVVESGGSATIRAIALEFLKYDESQVQYYETIVKQMPVKVLMRHDVISKDKDLVTLNTNKLTFAQRQRIRALCDEKLNEFLEKRGIKLWDYRLIDNPVPDSLRFRVLKDSDFRCDLCGATKKDRPLDVDHIIPRSKGGKTEEANLQVLCSKCNRSKGNKDKTDFRDTDFSDVEPDCVFCGEMDKNRIQDSNGSVFATKDKYPVTKGHHLIIPFRHTEDYFSMTEVERQDSTELIRKLKRQIQMSDTSVQGFNVGSNSGEVAGQTVAHAHIHLIPRRDGDTPHPKGGVRGVIPDKMDY